MIDEFCEHGQTTEKHALFLDLAAAGPADPHYGKKAIAFRDQWISLSRIFLGGPGPGTGRVGPAHPSLRMRALPASSYFILSDSVLHLP